MKRSIVLRCVVAAGALAGVVAISACSAGSIGAAAPSNPVSATPPTGSAQVTQPIAPVAVPGGAVTKTPAPIKQKATTDAAPAHVYLSTCGPTGGKLPIEMTNATISCDSTEILQNAHWSTWNSTNAQGSGVLLENDCTPACANGKQISRPVTIQFDKPIHTACGDFWGEAIFTYLGTPPQGTSTHNGKPAWVLETGPVSSFCS